MPAAPAESARANAPDLDPETLAHALHDQFSDLMALNVAPWPEQPESYRREYILRAEDVIRRCRNLRRSDHGEK